MEAGSRNHEIVPTPLIVQLSGLRGGSGVHKSISNLAKVNLIAKVKNAKCAYTSVFFPFFATARNIANFDFISSFQMTVTDSLTAVSTT